MSGQDKTTGQAALLTAVEYLLEVRQQQLAESLSEISHRGDREWTRRLRGEVDEASRLLQMLRTLNEQLHKITSSNTLDRTPP